MVADPGAFSQQPPPGLQAGLTVGLVYDGRTPSAELLECLRREGVQFAPAERIENPDALVLDLVDADRRQVELLMREQNNAPCPAVAALSEEHLLASDLTIEANDFIVVPWQTGELTLRIQRLTERKKPADDPGVIRVGDLVINPSRYDVFLAGKPVLLTFKEYELLKLLASTPGRVYSREVLLEQVWGYQYFGGTRTVDVHIRRLRSKIENATHTFIDTVWNVGYRFRG